MTARGASDAKRRIVDFMRSRLPGHLEAVRAEWGLTEAALPTPVSYRPAMPSAVTDYPTLAVTATNMSNTRLHGHTDTNERIAVSTYRIQLYLWVRYASQHQNDDAIEHVQIVRDDLTAAVRALLLTTPSLAQPDHRARLLETTMVEDYSDVQPVKGDRAVAASYLGFQVRVEETLARPPVSSVGTVTTSSDIFDAPGATS